MTDRAGISGSIRFAPFELVLEPEELRRNGIRVKVSGQALQVLIVLASEPGRLVTREHLRKTLADDVIRRFRTRTERCCKPSTRNSRRLRRES